MTVCMKQAQKGKIHYRRIEEVTDFEWMEVSSHEKKQN